jgi:glycosyltransferase involved in cell wall biosynthesis
LYGWETEYAASLPGLAADLGIADRVYFAGHRDDALAMMYGCDVVVHSSRRGEPFGLVVVEAMALGRAVIASRSGGPEEILDDGTTGLLVRQDDVNELAAAMNGLVADRARRADLGGAARLAAFTNHSAQTMAAGFASLYAKVTDEHVQVKA